MAINRELSQFGRLVQIIDNVSIGIGTTSNVSIGFGTITVNNLTATTINGSVSSATTTTNIPNLTGDVTSNGTVTSIATGIITNAKISASAAIDVTKLSASTISGVTLGNNLNTLTLATSGTGISGSTTYNGSTPTTFTVTSNATSLNQPSTIVSRDSSGNFSGGTVSATTFSGSNILVATSSTTGTLSQPLQVTGGAYVSGSVGIGTTNPSDSLTVSGKIQIQQDSGSNNRLVFRGTPSSSYRWNIDNYQSNNTFRIFREDDATSANGSVAVSISTTGTLTATKFSGDGSLLTNLPSGGGGGGTSSQWTTGATGITTTSSVGIKSTTPTSALDVTGDVKVSGIITATDFNSSSDINLKTNIQTIENPISKLFEINGVTFNWIENEKASVGVIAQDVEKALPQLVSDMGSHKVVNYNGLIGLLVECIKHQQRQIDELKEHMIGS